MVVSKVKEDGTRQGTNGEVLDTTIGAVDRCKPGDGE